MAGKLPRIKITFGELYDRFDMSDEVCDILGLNPYCLREGLATESDTVNVTLAQARLMGITVHEFTARAGI